LAAFFVVAFAARAQVPAADTAPARPVAAEDSAALPAASTPPVVAAPAEATAKPDAAANTAAAPPITLVERFRKQANPFVSYGDGITPIPLSDRKWLTCGDMWSWLVSTCDGLKATWYEGSAAFYFSGYAWHDPSTYNQSNLDELNSRAWGGGYGVSKDDDEGNNFSWYAMVFRDSHFGLTKMAGWGWMTYWPTKANVSFGLGYTAFIMARPDIFGGVPFPAALPLGSVKVYGFEVLGTFIPKLNSGVNHGNVAYFFARYQF
jgi:palmitoyl transferase